MRKGPRNGTKTGKAQAWRDVVISSEVFCIQVGMKECFRAVDSKNVERNYRHASKEAYGKVRGKLRLCGCEDIL